jgi:hypothetical protein
LPKAIWVGLIPVVLIERLIFAFAMAGLFMAVQGMVKSFKLSPGDKTYEIHSH